ncbi:MAG: energy-coupling factor transporter ATPase [Acutalibacteraceae bacterium]|nr:energy-coupling factor transporter ATPase [Acutalibacteraceae bacterium]
MSILKTENLNYVYSENTPFEMAALKNVNIEIEKGDFVGIIGHTGSGKSTLVQHFNGLVKPTSGKIYFNGEDIWADEKKINDLRFKVGLVFQYPEYQLFDATVESDIAFGPRNMGLSEEEIKIRVEMAAHYVGLSKDLLQKSPFDLSGGQKRRAALAGVLAMQPQVLILDEPTAGLDPIGRDTILDRISEFRKQSNTTILLVSHSMEDVAKVANKVLVMNNGEAVMFDTVENVYSHGDELHEMGLNIPHIAKVVMGLRKKGIDIPKGIYTVDKAYEALIDLFKKEGKLNAQ